MVGNGPRNRYQVVRAILSVKKVNGFCRKDVRSIAAEVQVQEKIATSELAVISHGSESIDCIICGGGQLQGYR